MKRPKILLYLLGFIVLGAGLVWAGTTTMTTYYPSPNGYYNNLFAQSEVGIGTTAPQVKLDLVGSLATGTVGTEDEFHLTRSFNAGVSWPQVAAFQLGNYGGGSGNNTRLDINLKSISSFALTADYNVMTLLSSGNVGIGETNPTAQLQVFPTNHTWGSGILLGSNTAPETSLAIDISKATGGYGTIQVADVNGHSWGNLNLENYGGNVGISTITPNEKLDIEYSSTHNGMVVGNPNGNYLEVFDDGNPHLEEGGPSSNLWIGGDNDNPTNIDHAGGNTILNDTSGNVGIGITTPARELEIYGSNPIEQIANSTTGFNGLIFDATGGWQSGFGTNQAAGYWYDFSNDLGTTHQLYYDGATWTFPVGSINVGKYANGNVNTLSMDTNQIWNSGLTAAGASAASGLYLQWSTPGGPVYVGYQTGATNDLYVQGTINSTMTITAASDGRLKQNIVPLTGTLSKLDQLRGVSFEWNHLSTSLGHKEGEKSIGMIAQELQKVYPELVVQPKDGHQYLAIDYGKFTAVLLQSIKELKSQVNTMQGQINALQEKVKSLEK